MAIFPLNQSTRNMNNAEIARCVIKAQAGCHESFGRLIARQRHIIRGIIRNRMRDKKEEDREDMFQEVMLHAWRNIKLIVEDLSRFPKWISILTKWRCAARRRDNPLPKQFDPYQLENNDRILFVISMHEKNFTDTILTREVIDYVKRAIRKLSKVDKDMLKSEFRTMETQREQSKRIGVCKATCRRRRKKARENFKKILLQMVAHEDLYVPS